MSKPKKRLEIQLTQEDEFISFSARIPEEQAKFLAKVLWGIIGGGVVWLASQMPAITQSQVPSSKTLPPAPAQVKDS